MVRKVTVSVSDELLSRIDAEARAAGVSRSELVQEASAHYLAHSLEERTAEVRRQRRIKAIERMGEIGRAPVQDARPSLEIIKEGRVFPGAPAQGSRQREDWEHDVGYQRWLKEQGLDDVDDAGI